MEEKLNAEEIVDNFFKKDNLKRGPYSPLLHTPNISFKIQCKNLEIISDYFYFLKKTTKRKSSMSRLLQNATVNSQDPDTALIEEKNRSFINTPGIFYEAIIVTEKNFSQYFQIDKFLQQENYESKLENAYNLGDQGTRSEISNVIFHSTPKWLKENIFLTNNGKFDKILIKLYKTKDSNVRKLNLLRNLQASGSDTLGIGLPGQIGNLNDGMNSNTVNKSKTPFVEENTSDYYLSQGIDHVRQKQQENLNEIEEADEDNSLFVTDLSKESDIKYLGFQLIPLFQLEKMKNLHGNFCLRLIESSPEKFFCQSVLEEKERLLREQIDLLGKDTPNILSHPLESSVNSKKPQHRKNLASEDLQDSIIKNSILKNNVHNYEYLYKSVISNINNHNIEAFKENEDLTSTPVIMFNYNYKTFGKLWKFTAIIHSIIQREVDDEGKPVKPKSYYDGVAMYRRNSDFEEDNTEKKSTGFLVKYAYQYRIFCKRNDGLNWFKEVSFKEIQLFREKLIEYIPEMKNYPFPKESFLAKIPIIGKYYSDENDDVLIEKKFTLDNFFDNLLEKEEAYRLEAFNEFFTSN